MVWGGWGLGGGRGRQVCADPHWMRWGQWGWLGGGRSLGLATPPALSARSHVGGGGGRGRGSKVTVLRGGGGGEVKGHRGHRKENQKPH